MKRAQEGQDVERTFERPPTKEHPVVDQNAVNRNAEKDPADWVTGDEPATGPQQSYLSTLAQEAGEQVDVDELDKAQASKKIEELQEKTGR